MKWDFGGFAEKCIPRVKERIEALIVIVGPTMVYWLVPVGTLIEEHDF